MIDILTIGDSSIDLFMKVANDAVVPELGKENESPKICFYHGTKIPVEHFETSIAGNAVNVAVGCATLGLKTAVYTELGDDSGAERIIEELKELGVNTKFCKKNKDIDTNLHSIIVYGGERTIFSYHGPKNYQVRNWGSPKWIYYTSLGEGFEKFQTELVDHIKNTNKKTGIAFNPGTLQMKAGVDSLRDILSIADILFVNKEETTKLTGASDEETNNSVESLHKKLQELGPKLTVITNGKAGSTAHDGTTMEKEGIYSDDRPVLDKTGAGDAYSSGFLSAIVYGKPLKEALRWGAINAGNVIKEIGAIKGLTSKEQIKQTF
jgi:ribokinase